MEQQEIAANSKKIIALETENELLRNEFKKLTEEIYPYRIFNEARSKFLAWIGLVTAVIAVFGFVSVTDIIANMKKSIESRGTETIINEIKEDLKKDKTLQDRIVKETKEELRPQLQGIADQAVRESVTESFANVQQQLPKSEGLTLAQAAEESFKEQRFFVVAASSTIPSEVENELERVKSKIGTQFEKNFPGVKICQPKQGNERYALVIGANLSLSKAEELKEQARKSNFQNDTYILRDNKAFFQCE